MSNTNRINRLREKLAEQDLAGLFVSAPAEDIHHTIGANRRYLSSFSGSMGHLLVTLDAAYIAVDFRYFEQAERESPEYTLFKANGGMKTWLPELLGETKLGGKKLGFESSGITYGMYATLRDAVTSLSETDRPSLTPTDGIVETLRAFKEPDELEALDRAVALGDAAFEHVAARIEPGWTEKQVALEIERYALDHGAEGLSFPTIVAAGPWGAMPHAQPRDHVIQQGDGVVIDMGVSARRLHVRPDAHRVRRHAGRQVPQDLRHRPRGAANGRGADPHRHDRRRRAHDRAQGDRGGRLRR